MGPPPQEREKKKGWQLYLRKARYACRNHSAYDIDAERNNAAPLGSEKKSSSNKEKENNNNNFYPSETHTRPDSATVNRTWFGKTGFLVSLPPPLSHHRSNDSALLTGLNVRQRITMARVVPSYKLDCFRLAKG